MNTTDSAKVSDANAGANNVIHIPHNPTLAGLATLTRNVAYKTGADNLVMDIISPQSTGDDDDRLLPKQTIMPQPQNHRHEKPPIPWTSISMSKKREAVQRRTRPWLR